MKWFKVHNEMIHDPKIRALAFEDRWHFVAIMCLTNDGTLDEPADLRDELVSVALGLHGIDLEKCKARLMRLRLIGADWKPCNWEKRQESSDPKAAERMRKFREAREAKRNVTRTLRIEGEEEVEVEGDLKVSKAPPAPTPIQEIIEIYHRELPNLPSVVAINESRKRLIRAHHLGIMEASIENWRGYFQAVRRSDFLMGRKKDWRADFDFLLKPKTPIKVLEGSYS
jgi:hypothetical protein